MKQTTYKNGKTLRYGYTTGTCAAAATKAALLTLLSGNPVERVEVMTPKGWRLKLKVETIHAGPESVTCGIVKDSGDDPDITNGILVQARVCPSDKDKISGGLGVGKVTKKGLPVEVGLSAINPVPFKMIQEEIKAIRATYSLSHGFQVVISIPGGEEIAKKTFNPRLGIVGGLSILGTSGIVEPMSEEAFKDSLHLELKAKGLKDLIYVPGNYGYDFMVNQGVKGKSIQKISNFVGFMFEKAVEEKVESVILCGHIGKLVKIAAGVFHTHSRVADARISTLVYALFTCGCKPGVIKLVSQSNTTEEAVDIILEYKMEAVFEWLVNEIKRRLEVFVFDNLNVEVIMISMVHGQLSKTEGVDQLLRGAYE